ncbi:MAG: cupin domain-containing protein [Atopobiaceae bacterium]|nr:cupin domain-containing protein [Atopobiaceae bacterium]MBQ6650677.1 cupin domain-containing protein [Atopobiaceae bacterium]MBR3385310.1 cupin domain-containing protein [Atopobiaceae bacterium]
MIRRREDQAIEFKCIRGGHGEVEMRKICESVEELYGKGRLFNLMVLAPGDSIGEHTHEGDNEIFYFLKGAGTYNDNGTLVKVGPGDTAICNDGELHGLVNDGDVPLEFIALILY